MPTFCQGRTFSPIPPFHGIPVYPLHVGVCWISVGLATWLQSQIIKRGEHCAKTTRLLVGLGIV